MDLQTSNHLAGPTLLRKIDELREKNIGQHVPLPQLVVVGDQSSGKSSLLESLTGIPFPRNLELCTRYATQITSRRDSELRVKIAIIPGPRSTDAHRRQLDEYRPKILSTDDLRAQFSKILAEVNIRMGIRTDTSSSHGIIFSEDVLKIEICGPQEDYLTVIDVPGIFRTPTEGITTKDDIKLVQSLVKEYIKNTRTVILAVLPSNVDTATQEILMFAEEFDKSGERTLGVLTKPDLVTEHSAQEIVCNLVLGKRKPLTLGYHIVRNRGADDGADFDYSIAEQIFRKEPWASLPKDRLGVLALKLRLSELLGEITRKEFPKLRKEVKKELEECQKELESIGPARQTDQDQRVYLSGMTRQFQSITNSALNAHYSAHDAFDDRRELRLITSIVNFTELFNDEFERKAHLRCFEDPKATVQDNKDHDSIDREDTSVLFDGNNPVEDIELSEFAILDDIVSKDCHLDDPIGGIMDWIKDLYIGSRGVELGTFGGIILSSAFKKQSTKWASITKTYLSNVIIVIHRFMVALLDVVCTDARVREEIWSSILDEVLKRYKFAMDQAMFLVNIEQGKRPYTLNHYFNENLQIARNRRKAEALRGKARNELRRNSYNSHTYSSDNLIVDLDSVKEVTTSKSNLEHIKEEIHDILMSYYKVARKRFVDNIYLQAVDHCLLTGPMSPLAVFSQEWVIILNAEQLEAIAGESPVLKSRREALLKKIEDLQVAIRILRR